jgi:hypothetical protein
MFKSSRAFLPLDFFSYFWNSPSYHDAAVNEQRGDERRNFTCLPRGDETKTTQPEQILSDMPVRAHHAASKAANFLS